MLLWHLSKNNGNGILTSMSGRQLKKDAKASFFNLSYHISPPSTIINYVFTQINFHNVQIWIEKIF
ncbi:hypothetical protein BAZ10_16030 [Elizabethkingia occulta]|uniref:Uncharacterized protein n=1 Tax=Elizabethkingia occulta TaxID=1867263 RepID=A0A1T3MSJ2_9FLAO|nr:hypothetical protein BAZ10_16030 [Elizabethkingia occulta]